MYNKKMKNHIIFITGPSGVGKTTIFKLLKSSLERKSFDVRDLDERGVPDNVTDQWRIDETKHYLEIGKNNINKNITTIVCGYVLPEELFSLPNSDIVQCIILDADDRTIVNRLEKRYSDPKNIDALKNATNETTEEFTRFALESAQEFRNRAKKHNYNIIDTTYLNPRQIIDIIKRLL